MLNHVIESKKLAESAVADGDDTLKKANTTYHLLQSFNSEVQKSSENAKIALQDVPSIDQQIRETEEIIQKAENVRKNSIEYLKLFLRHFILRHWKNRTTMQTKPRLMPWKLKNVMLIKLQR